MRKELMIASVLCIMLCFGGVFACETQDKPNDNQQCNQDQEQGQNQGQTQGQSQSQTTTNTNVNTPTAIADSSATVKDSGNSANFNNNDNDATVKDSGNSENKNINNVNVYTTVCVSQYVKQTNKQRNNQEQTNTQEQDNEQNPTISNDAGLVVLNGETFCMDQDGRLCPCTVSEDGYLVVKAEQTENATAVPMETTGGSFIPAIIGITAGGIGMLGAAKQGWLGRFGL